MKKKRHHIPFNKLRDTAYILFTIFCFVFLIYRFSKRIAEGILIKKDPVFVKAVIVDDKIFPGHGRAFTYAYSFFVNGKEYRGNSNDESMKVGDSVEIKYVRSHPFLNEAVHPKN